MISLFKSRTLCAPPLPACRRAARLPRSALAPPPQREGAGLRVSTLTPTPVYPIPLIGEWLDGTTTPLTIRLPFCIYVIIVVDGGCKLTFLYIESLHKCTLGADMNV